MNKAELKQLSDDTFFNNDTGEIQPPAHRNWNDKLLESVVFEEALPTADVNAIRVVQNDGTSALATPEVFGRLLGPYMASNPTENYVLQSKGGYSATTVGSIAWLGLDRPLIPGRTYYFDAHQNGADWQNIQFALTLSTSDASKTQTIVRGVPFVADFPAQGIRASLSAVTTGASVGSLILSDVPVNRTTWFPNLRDAMFPIDLNSTAEQTVPGCYFASVDGTKRQAYYKLFTGITNGEELANVTLSANIYAYAFLWGYIETTQWGSVQRTPPHNVRPYNNEIYPGTIYDFHWQLFHSGSTVAIYETGIALHNKPFVIGLLYCKP